jgi:hypothetical protein
LRALFAPFLSPDGKPHWPIIALFALINGIVTFNCFQHEYTIGYDAEDHLEYVRVLSDGRLPTPKESMEFFCPPLPYAPAAVIRAAGVADEEALKKGKELQAIYSFVLTFFLMKLCREISPDARLRVWTLVLLGMIPAYYRSFVMIRGEPMLAMWATVGIWLAVRMFVNEDGGTWRRAAALGVVLACAALSRQWAILLLPAVAMLALFRAFSDRATRRRTLAHLAIAACVFALLAAPFYVHLRLRYGSTTAFNRAPTTAPLLQRHSASFYTNIPLKTLVTAPIKHNLAGTMLPIYYSDLWGDYWCYYVVYARTRGREFRA